MIKVLTECCPSLFTFSSGTLAERSRNLDKEFGNEINGKPWQMLRKKEKWKANVVIATKKIEK